MTEKPQMLAWEIINPSDKYTITAPTFAAAAAAALLIGEGKLALEPEHDEGQRMPLFLFGGHEEFIAEHFGGDLVRWIDDHKSEVADALDSVLLGGLGRRADYDAAVAAIDDPEKLARFRERWQEKRSSMNDIGGYAHRLAAHLRGKGDEHA